MAFNITTLPNVLTPIENGFIFGGTLTDLGTDPEIKRAGWQLENDSGGIVAEKSSTRPGTTSDPIILDFKRNIRALVKTTMPTAGIAPGVQQDSTIIKSFKLRSGDIVINKDTGAVTDNVSNLSAAYKVFNGANNIFDEALITSDAGVHILTWRPTTYSVLRESLDYIWVLGSGSVEVTINYSDGTDDTAILSLAYAANIVPVGLPFFTTYMTGGHTADDVTSLEIDIAGVKTYTVSFEPICDTGSPSFMEVLFLEPAGGRSCMVFQDLTNVSADSQRTTAHIYKSLPNIAAMRLDGDTVIDSRTYGTYAFKRQIGSDPDEVRWMQGFAAATEHHLLIKDRGGNRFWAKFILDGTPSINLESKEMVASGRLARPIYSPYAQ